MGWLFQLGNFAFIGPPDSGQNCKGGRGDGEGRNRPGWLDGTDGIGSRIEHKNAALNQLPKTRKGIVPENTDALKEGKEHDPFVILKPSIVGELGIDQPLLGTSKPIGYSIAFIGPNLPNGGKAFEIVVDLVP